MKKSKVGQSGGEEKNRLRAGGASHRVTAGTNILFIQRSESGVRKEKNKNQSQRAH